MKKFTLAAGCAASLLFGAGLSAATIDEVYAFGDSLNDCCFSGPFTNGSNTWLVEFSANIGASYSETQSANYAVGGAQSGPFNAIGATDASFGFDTGLQTQIDRFETSGTSVDVDDLAVIWVGTNDIWASAFPEPLLFGLETNQPLGPRPAVDDLVDYITGNIDKAIEDLRDSGFGNVLLLSPYDVGQSALTDGPESTALSTAYSLALRDALSELYNPGVDTYFLDMVNVLTDMQTDASLGFSHFTGFDSCGPLGSPDVCAARPQAEQDSFIFYDAVHLTTAANSVVANSAAAIVTNGTPIAPVSLPSALLLVLAGLGGLGAARGFRRP